MSQRYTNPLQRNRPNNRPNNREYTNTDQRSSRLRTTNNNLSNIIDKNQRARHIKNSRGVNRREFITGRSEFKSHFDTMERRRLEDPLWMDTTKSVITKRYDTSARYLDLARLSTDPDLTNSQISIDISLQGDVGALFKIILSVANNLTVLSLSGNNLSKLGPISHFLRRFKGLTKLNLSDNNIDNVSQIRRLNYIKLDEIILRNNPIFDLIKDNYIGIVRRIFPTLRILDNVELPIDVNSEIKQSVSLPERKLTCCSNQTFAETVGKFINQYFSYLDGGNASALVDAYHNDAILTLSANTYRCNGLMPDIYVSNSRNMKFFAIDDNRKDNVTCVGRTEIITLLKQIPPSKHNAVTFDMNFETPTYAVFTVSGTVFDVLNETPFLFVRTYCVVPNMSNNGFFIINEQITICKSPHKNAVPISNPPATSSVPRSLVNLSPPELELVNNLSKNTGMVLPFALECLVGNKWDLSHAISDFNQLKAKNLIPKEAFIS